NIVKYLNFTGEATLGKILTKVEMLYNTSTLVALDPPGELYRNFNVWTGFQGWFSSDHVYDPVLTFAVDKSWVTNNNIDPSSISLFFYNVNKWDKVPTQKISEDSLTYYFKANLPITGTLGPMAVSGQISPSATIKSTPTQTQETNPAITDEQNKSTPGFQIFTALITIIVILIIGRK
ncbi:MAG: PGF-pre-PGF domain-containing protein, partial [ANME-2 cluster archaeon]